MGAVGEAEERSLPRREGLQEAPHPRDGSTECSVKAGISQQLNHTLQPALASWADPSPRADWVFTDIVSRVPGREHKMFGIAALTPRPTSGIAQTVRREGW